jgi:hypothetical protein
VVNPTADEPAPAKRQRKPKEVAAPTEVAEAPAPVDKVINDALKAGDEVTLEMIQSLTRKKAQDGKKDALKSLVDEFGVGRISDLSADQYEAFYAKAQKI